MAQSFYPTAQVIIDTALQHIRAVDPDSSIDPTTTQRTNALRVLNMIVTSWQAHGMQVWCQKQGTTPMVAAQGSYTVGPSGDINIQRPLSIQQAWIRDTTQTIMPDIPVRIIGREEYNMLSVKTQTGTPNCLYYDPKYSVPDTNSGATAKGNIQIWPVPGTSEVATYDLYFIYTRPIQDFAATSDTLDFPQEWSNALSWSLAADIAHSFGVPIQYLDRLTQKAKREFDLVSGWDADQSSMFLFPERAWGR